MGNLKVNGKELFYHQTGHGSKNVVVVHGGPGLTFDYLKVIHELLPTDEFTVFSYNQSGSFNSTAEYYLTITDYAEELKAIIDHIGTEDCTIIGHSWGVAIVLQLLIEHPSMTKKAILMNGFSSGKQLKEAIQHRINKFPAEFHSQRKSLLAKNDAEGYAGLLFQYWVPKHVCNLSEIPEDLMLSVTRQTQPAFNHFMGPDILNINGELLNWDRSSDLSSITTPILLMSGKDDYLSKKETENMQLQLGNAQLWFSEIASHMPMHEDQENFKNALINFLKSNGG